MRGISPAWIAIFVLAIAAIVLVARHSDGMVGGVSNADFASLAAAVAMLIAIGGSMIAGRRVSAGTALRHATTWLGAILILVTVYSYRYEFGGLVNRVLGELVPGAPFATTNAAGQTVVTVRRDASGHFGVRGRVNGAAARFLIDTGASALALTTATAEAAGIDIGKLRFSVPIETANGTAFMAPATVGRLQIGPLSFADIHAYVAPPGALADNLLGVNVLDQLESYSVSGDEMRLVGGG